MPVPQNAQAIYTFLTGQGFTPNAAAGILGNIEQESGGNPEEQGGGLIQILGQAGGTLTEQLAATMKYILANGSVADINAHATTPQDAALYFSTAYERPNAALANNANREASALAVAQAAQSGNWPKGTATATTTSATPDSTLSWLTGIPSRIRRLLYHLSQPDISHILATYRRILCRGSPPNLRYLHPRQSGWRLNAPNA